MARMERIAAVTINSTSVRPRSPWWPIRFVIDSGFIALLHHNADLRSGGQHLFLGAVHGRRMCNYKVALTSRLGLETEDANGARSAQTRSSRRTRGVNVDQARPVVAVNQHHGLPVAT